MKEQSWHFLDRTNWGVGAWDSEPDKRQWTDPTTGYACMVRRGYGGAWCGYVGVPEGHPLHGAEVALCRDLRVHGGVTLCTSCEPGEDASAICHTPEPGEPESVWWVGFDCAHADDYSPGVPAMLAKFNAPALLLEHERGGVYRDLAYVTNECAFLALELQGLTTNRGNDGNEG